MIYRGGCHCQAVKYEVETSDNIEVYDCNCSICSKSGILSLVVPRSKFTLVSGEESMTTYQFDTGVAQHTFCKICGIKSFYTPRSNPDGISVNINCLETKPASVKITPFDGQNWENHAHKIAHKSKDT